ncbi:hypothetical protein BDZ94DRAFT_1259920 [Collybia nuda]|uniref:Novel STAND NTPase 1 domain-containing protein n=1 Tax=Collybia nuda TaxID=64659 RepID=A0A9P5Y6D0_9AGAR|nr:hypothetical protein BDZ94DRAFT_1259920 [Collybia nuda]
MLNWVITIISMVFGINRPKHVRDFRKASDTLTAAPVPPPLKPVVEQALKLTKAGRRQNATTDAINIEITKQAIEVCLDVVETVNAKSSVYFTEFNEVLGALEVTLTSVLNVVDKPTQRTSKVAPGSGNTEDAISALRKKLHEHESAIKALSSSNKRSELPRNPSSAGISSGWSQVSGRSSSYVNSRSSSKVSFQHIPPPPPAIFFGRNDQLTTVVNCITSSLPDRSANIALLGTGGVGKSSLALAVLHNDKMVTSFEGHRYFVRCDTARSAEDLLAAIAKELGLSGSKVMERVPKVLAEISPRVLLVLDNFETPWEPEDSRTEVEETLQRLSVIETLSLIITIRGQQCPRGTLWTKPLGLTPFDLPAAHMTFSTIVPALGDDPNLDELLKCVDCLPLAVTLLAAVAEGEPSVENILARWRVEKTRFVKDGSGNTQRGSLEASIEVSIQSARMKSEPTALQLLSLLALLPNGISVADTQTPALGLRPSALGAVSMLRKVALVYDDSANSRIRVLSPIQIYVSSQYPPSPILLKSLQAHYAGISQLGKKIGKRDGEDALPKLKSEAENIQAIVEHALTIESEEKQLSWTKVKWALEAATNLTDFLWYSGLGSTRSLDIAANVARDLQEPSGEADCLSSIGFVASGRAEYALAEDSYLAALERYRAQQNVAGEAECLRGLGFVAHHVADFEKAIPYFLDGIVLFKKLGSKWGEGECLKGLAMISSATSNFDDASEKYAKALQLFINVGNMTGEADCMRGEGYIALNIGGEDKLEVAAQNFAKARELFDKVGKLTGAGDCLQGMGRVELLRNNLEVSKLCFEEAYEVFNTVGHPWKKALCLKNLGDIALKMNDKGAAKLIYDDALQLFIEVKNKKGEADCLSALTML